MEMYHITIATDGRRRLFAEEGQLRRGVRTLARVAGAELALFNIPDDHIHTVMAGNRQRVGRLAQALHAAISPLVAVPLEPARPREVESRRHLQSLVGYVLNQGPRHGLAHDPALWTGSCFLDLMGARSLPGLALQIRKALPRLRIGEIAAAVGLEKRPIRPAGDDAIFRLGPTRLVAAAAAAAGEGPTLRGRSAGVVGARAVAARLGVQVGFSASDLARALDVTPRTARRLRDTPVRPSLVQATRVMLALESVVAATRRDAAAPFHALRA